MPERAIDHNANSFGILLKQWRDRRSLSQLDLALNGQVSQRHISFLESGRAKPSQEMVLQLANVLEIPLRHQNLLLSAAGFVPIHTETDLSAPEMSSIRKAIGCMLHQQEPYPAVVIDRYWNLLLTNNGATRLLNTFIEPEKLQTLFCIDGKINLMRVTFDPQGLRPFIANWAELAGYLLHRVHREENSSNAQAHPLKLVESEQSTLLFDELISYPDVADLWNASSRSRTVSAGASMQNDSILTTHFQKNDLSLRFFSTIATLGTPHDITLQEIRIECLFPADEVTEHNWCLI
jgi:transcriptional regulator with XRE-family HTH domain